ncbi:MAG: MerC domain-containing protein [Erythrobacter sp.]
MLNASTFDRAAVMLSFLCVLHCAALPFIVIALPFLSAMAEAEWVHWLMAVLAVGASAAVFFTSASARTPAFLIPAIFGNALIGGALFAENFGLSETAPTLIGGAFLAAAHAYRLFTDK